MSIGPSESATSRHIRSTRRGVGDVAAHEARVVGDLALQLAKRGLGGGVVVGVVHRRAGAGLGQGEGDLLAQAAGAAGHQGDPTVESE